MIDVWLVEVGFVVEGTLIAESRVKASAVIKALQIIEDAGVSLIPVGPVAAVNQLVLERVPKRHLGGAGRLAAAVGVVQQAWPGRRWRRAMCSAAKGNAVSKLDPMAQPMRRRL